MIEKCLKRAELHLHTNMSEMSAVGLVEDYMAFANENGINAIAITDNANVRAFPQAYQCAKKYGIKLIYGMEGYMTKSEKQYHVTILVKNRAGLKSLYKIVTASYTKYFNDKPCIPQNIISDNRGNLLIGSACTQGELYQAVLEGKSDKELCDSADYYDFLEVQPFNDKDINKKIVELGTAKNITVTATSNAHYVYPEDSVAMKVLLSTKDYDKCKNMPPLHIRTIDEMISEFEYLGYDKAFEISVTNTQKIADMIEDTFEPILSGEHYPIIKDTDKLIKNSAEKRLHELYGKNPPKIIKERLKKELLSIEKNGFASIYIIVSELVNEILKDGYITGTRGAAGSSFVAYLLGMTEINPLPAHYICQKCHFTEFVENAGCGADLPKKNCPVCGEKLKKCGFNIPFEAFAGIDGSKFPDIELNIPEEARDRCISHLKNKFGNDNIVCAGDVRSISGRVALYYIADYQELTGRLLSENEKDRAFALLRKTARTTGTQPGGIFIVPAEESINDFTPVQYEEYSRLCRAVTHFDYTHLRDILYKLNILSHDSLTILKKLGDLTGVNPLEIPLDDEKTMELFKSADTDNIPEFSTKFVKDIIKLAKPKTLDDLIRISALSHGTGTWANNAETLIKSGKANLSEVISCRDDVYLYLRKEDFSRERAFEIAYNVRMGRFARGMCEEDIKDMREKNIPDWYISSCRKIDYLFPRAHSATYVLMAYRLAYYKAHYPTEFLETIKQSEEI